MKKTQIIIIIINKKMITQDMMTKIINTLNNEIINNRESIQIPIINTDIVHLEKQYKKIKKDLNDLYPVFSKNKQYREKFFCIIITRKSR